MTDEEKWYEYCKAKKLAWWTQDDEEREKRIYFDGLAKSIIPYQEKGYIFDEDLHEIYFRANGELMVKASLVEELKAQIEKLKKENEELKAQIEKMKNCENCSYAYDKKHDCMPCKDMEDWKLMK